MFAWRHLRYLAFGLLVTFVFSGCDRVFFYPTTGYVLKPDALSLEWSDLYFDTSDGERLHAWVLEPTQPAFGTILFLHGNAENISTHIASVYWLPAEGFRVILLDYRGYGSSTGSPDLEMILSDLEQVLKTLCSAEQKFGDKIFVFGQSLGAALAIDALAHSAYRDRIVALIAESSFASYREIVRDKLSDLFLTWPLQYPLSFLVSDSHAPLKSIAQISPVPTLFIHSKGDRIVPFHHTEKLFEIAKEPKEFWRIDAGDHLSPLRDSQTRERLIQYLKQKSLTNIPAL